MKITSSADGIDAYISPNDSKEMEENGSTYYTYVLHLC